MSDVKGLFDVSEALLGRVVNAFGEPIDDKGGIESSEAYPVHPLETNPLERKNITEPLGTGVRTIDGLLTCGMGQRIGIFGGSGVGKSTLLGMMAGLFLSKITGINNYQTRAISLETGLRNASLAMTIALLIQDAMGDFYSSLFFTSAIFGLVMYLAGVISLYLFKPLLPLPAKTGD